MHLTALGGYLASPPCSDRAGVARNNRVIRKMFPEFPRHNLRLHRLVAARAVGFHHRPPVLHAGLRSLEESSMLVALQQRQKALKRTFRIADESDFNGISQSDTHGIQFEL